MSEIIDQTFTSAPPVELSRKLFRTVQIGHLYDLAEDGESLTYRTDDEGAAIPRLVRVPVRLTADHVTALAAATVRWQAKHAEAVGTSEADALQVGTSLAFELVGAVLGVEPLVEIARDVEPAILVAFVLDTCEKLALVDTVFGTSEDGLGNA